MTRLQTLLFPVAFSASLVGCNTSDVVEHKEDDAQSVGDEAELTKLAFDPNTVREIAGTVSEVQPFQRMKGTRHGIRVLMTVADSSYYVYLGPERYLDREGLKIEKGDALKVEGSTLDGNGRKVVIATRVTKAGKTVRLRDAKGRPSWRSWFGKPRA